MTQAETPTPLRHDLLTSEQAQHGFFTRAGGVSHGIYSGLNIGLGSNDERPNVQENRKRVAGWFAQPVASLTTVYQVHSPDVLVVESASQASDSVSQENRPKADALVTNSPGIILGVLTADCGPVLFLDPENRVAGAAHAGWKGALYGVLENTIDAMVQLGANRTNIVAVLGPSISAANYEVGPEFVERFMDYDTTYERYFSPSAKTSHAMFDLPALTVDRLREAGIRADATGHCTYADEALFFSYRRTTHRQEPDYGRQISAIMLS
jgi:YfiH family protein